MNSESKYYINAILLKDCSYSNAAGELLKNYKIKNKIEVVTSENKEKFKLENYDTYPQIFLKDNDPTRAQLKRWLFGLFLRSN